MGKEALGVSRRTNHLKKLFLKYNFLEIHLKFHGQAGHGSIIHPNTAAEKFHYVISKFLEYREREKERLKSAKHIGDVTTVNLTKVLGGVQTNVVPSLLEAWFDCRVAVDVDMQKYEEMVCI